jgi:hypothetical protein
VFYDKRGKEIEMRTLRLLVGAVALMLGAVLAVGAAATPVAKTVAAVE